MERDSSEPKQHPSSLPALSPKVAKLAAAALLALVLCGISFYSGVVYQKGHNPTPIGGQSAQGGSMMSGAGGFRMRRGSIGSVAAVSATNITVQDQRSGTNKTFTIDSSTQITKDGAAIAASDIQVGDTVLVRIASASATTAASITINPSLNAPAPNSAYNGPTQSI